MKGKNLSFAAFLIVAIAIIGIIGTIVRYTQVIDDKKSDPVYRLPSTKTIETEVETLDETDIVFEPVEENDTITHDTSGSSPQMNNIECVVFEDYKNVEEINKAYTNDDLLYLAKIVYNEAGSDFCTDEHQRAVASVVMNRVADPRFPDTIYGVISQGWNGECPLQYAVGGVERFNALEPSKRAIENARYILENGPTVIDAIWQAEFPQGSEILATFSYPEIYSVVTYICK